MTLRRTKNRFADAALKDTLRRVNVSSQPDRQDFQERLMAMPVSIDTMALLLIRTCSQAGIPTAPTGGSSFRSRWKNW